MPVLINLLAFHLLWLLVISAAFAGADIWVLSPVLVWLAVHLRYSRVPLSDLKLVIIAALFGPLIDTLLIQSGFVLYEGYAPIRGMAPLWIVALWVNFALLLNHSLAIIKSRPFLAALSGAIAGPAAYAAGAALGAAHFKEPIWVPLLMLGVAWAAFLPILLKISVGRPGIKP